MAADALIPFLSVMAVATYFQTVTGFGLGMIVMGAASSLDLATVGSVAAVVNLVSLVNSAVALPGTLHHVDRRIAWAATLGILPSTIAGVLLLDYLSSAASDLLRLLLGAAIVYGGLTFALRPAPLAHRSGSGAFFVSGVFGGLLGGLFGVTGPPLIFQAYRQPMSLVEIRSMLLLVFTIGAIARTLFTAVQGQLTAGIWLQSALAVPVVALAALAGRRYPPPFAPDTMRRIAFMVLIGIGGYLVLSTLPGVSMRA